jgi:mycothiol system anti-sigma-R factor
MNVERPAEESFDDCEHVLERVYEFLDNEIDAASGDAIRHHLAMCEPCLERFDVEEAVKSLVHRCCGGEVAPSHLRTRIVTQLTVLRRTI